MSEGLRHLKSSVRRALVRGERAASVAVDRLRNGDRVVLCPPQAGLRLGNLLYLWLNAHHRTASGDTVFVRESAGMVPWRREFPGLRPLTLTAEQMRFSDRREWDAAWMYQRFGVDFTREQLAAFVHDVFDDHREAKGADRLVVNVRRGDFYGTEFEAKHGFEIVPYLEAALAEFPRGHDVLVVSDDPAWCRENLEGMLHGRASAVEYSEPDPLRNLLTIARADKIIGANSTFSYWGAYIADASHENAQIVMPRFHARMDHGSDAHQLDPRWTTID